MRRSVAETFAKQQRRCPAGRPAIAIDCEKRFQLRITDEYRVERLITYLLGKY
jgi:hypothetical protein